MKELFKKTLRGIVKGAIYLYCKIVYRVKIIGKENIPEEGPLIFCANHRSLIDPPLIACTAGKHVRFLAKEELYKSAFLRLLGFAFEAIKVHRDSKDLEAIKTSLKTLKSGKSIALFPEGTRNGMEKGEKVKDGAAFFALNSDAKVIPVGIHGGEKPFKRIYIKYGKPLDFSEYKANKKDKETLDKVTEEIMNNIIMLTK